MASSSKPNGNDLTVHVRVLAVEYKGEEVHITVPNPSLGGEGEVILVFDVGKVPPVSVGEVITMKGHR